MSNFKVDIDKFDGSGDYKIWRRKIRSRKTQLNDQKIQQRFNKKSYWRLQPG